MRIGFTGNRLGHRFERAVEHLGGQHASHAQRQQAPLVEIHFQHNARGDDQQGGNNVYEEAALPAGALLQAAKCVAELPPPMTGGGGRGTRDGGRGTGGANTIHGVLFSLRVDAEVRQSCGHAADAIAYFQHIVDVRLIAV